MLVEADRRREHFAAEKCDPVVFGDGQEWHVLRPGLMYFAKFRDGKATHAEPTVGYTAEIDDLISVIPELEGDAIITAVSTLAQWLLQQNYNLTSTDLDTLLCVRPDDPSSAAWIDQVMTVATMGRPARVEDAAGVPQATHR